VKALSRFRGSEIVVPEAEMAALVDDRDASVRAAAIGALPTLRLETSMLDKLILRLGDEHVGVRGAAFFMLRKRVQAREGDKLAIELRQRAFAAALAMPDATLLQQARAGLRTKSIEPEGGEFLLRFLKHQDPKVRAQAVTTFGEMGKDGRKHVAKLRKLLGDPKPKVRFAAKRAIERIQGTGKKGPGTKRLKLK
jgi:HEAT repeat protein